MKRIFPKFFLQGAEIEMGRKRLSRTEKLILMKKQVDDLPRRKE